MVEGRCLSYGEGITYWPVIEVVEQLGAAGEQLLAGSPGAAETLGALLGEAAHRRRRRRSPGPCASCSRQRRRSGRWWSSSTTSTGASRRFLDLVEHIADMSRQAPILLLCMARPELLERRPGWGGGKLNATTVLLEPLDSAETDELIGRLLGERELEPGLGERIRLTAEGNPLFLEEMVAMLRDSGGERGHRAADDQGAARRAARPARAVERSVLERGAVEGQLFHRAAVEALAREPAPVERELAALVRKELSGPTGRSYRLATPTASATS